MSDDRTYDLVPVTAIIAGAVVSVAVTLFSLMGIGDELTDRGVDDDYPEFLEDRGGDGLPHGMGPLGEMRGPTDVEWEVIRTYKVIETMTATEPSDRVVDEALVQLWSYARWHSENGYIQQLFLKGVRVAQYYAFDRGDFDRADQLLGAFDAHLLRSSQYESTVLESMRMIVQRLGQSCENWTGREAELNALAARVSDQDELEWILRDAERALAFCSTWATG